jgi:hypothetical protein
MISQDLISDEHFNSISLDAQNIFIRMLSVSDDCGVVPANPYRLNVLINTPNKLRPRLDRILGELVGAGMGYLFEYHDEKFFAFKPSSFEDYQSYILKKATKSEYLRIPKDEFATLSKSFQELPRTSGRVDGSALSTVESKEYKVESKEQKAERGFVVPSEREVIDYFSANGYSKIAASKAFRYYSEAKWHDAKGSPVKNWKQKMISVWFKDENKAKGIAVRGPKLKHCERCDLDHTEIMCPRCYPEKSEKRAEIPMPKEAAEAIATLAVQMGSKPATDPNAKYTCPKCHKMHSPNYQCVCPL